ncbi:MAG: hypothetical protein KGY66_03165 [Candidatus Thermoplasmatota archaeon]|nr:hypothetical protein [Candidatus Thermoplasmatota archaeon]MBS3789894.1 hypothetical protein [Candidatus Thermoplasmatota archaeon]
MLPSWLEIIGSFLIIIIGIFYLLRVIYNHRLGKKIWDVYEQVFENKNLEVKKSLNLLSNWPNLYGEIDGKKVYVHPDRGGRKSPSKTIFAVKNKIDLSNDLIINKSEVNQPEGTDELEVQNINKYNLNIYSRGEIDEDQADSLFSSEIARKINKLIERNEEDFRAVIFEPGLAMFSTFKIDLDKDSISDNIKDFLEIVTHIEEKTSKSNEHLESLRMMRIKEGTKSEYIKGLIPLLLFGVTGFLLYQTIQDFSLLFLNLTVVIALVGIVKLYVFLYNEWKYQ